MKYLELTIASFALLIAAALPSAAKVVLANDVAAQQRAYCGADQSCINILINIDAGCMGDYDRIHGIRGNNPGVTYLDTECVKDAMATLGALAARHF